MKQLSSPCSRSLRSGPSSKERNALRRNHASRSGRASGISRSEERRRASRSMKMAGGLLTICPSSILPKWKQEPRSSTRYSISSPGRSPRAPSVPPSPSTHRPQRLSIKTLRITHEPSSQFTSKKRMNRIATKSRRGRKLAATRWSCRPSKMFTNPRKGFCWRENHIGSKRTVSRRLRVSRDISNSRVVAISIARPHRVRKERRN